MKSRLEARKFLGGESVHLWWFRGSNVASGPAHMCIWSMFGKKNPKIGVWG